MKDGQGDEHLLLYEHLMARLPTRAWKKQSIRIHATEDREVTKYHNL